MLTSEEAHHAVSLAHYALRHGDDETALAILEDATKRRPDSVSAQFGLAMTRRRQRDWIGARDAFRKVAELEPERRDIHHWIATMTSLMGDVEQALVHMRDAVELDPDNAAVQNDLGAMLLSLRRFDEAREAFERAAELDPEWSVPVHNLGMTATRSGNRDLGRELLLRASEMKNVRFPTQLELSMQMLHNGNYAEGWPRYEWRGDNHGKPQERPDLRVPVWDGSPLAGRTLLLWHEQGLGDVLQFVRFASLIPKDGGRVIVYSPKPIASVIATCPGVDRVAVDGDTLDIDLQFPLLSLPHLLGLTPEAGPPYLSAPAECPDADAAIIPGETFNVGIVWASGRLYPLHGARDCPLGLFAALADVPGVKLFSLQFGEAVPELESSPRPIVDLSPILGDFHKTAAFVKRLDLVITVDTSLAHLAGAIGAPVWTLICASPDWRWHVDGEETPWYPTMRLYRQQRIGDWVPVMERIARDLARITAGRFPSWTPPVKREVVPKRPKRAPRVIIKQYGETCTGSSVLRKRIAANHPDAEVLVHILGDAQSPPVPFDDLRREAAARTDPAWSFVASATYGRPGEHMKPGNADQTAEIWRVAPHVLDALDRGELNYLVSIQDPYAWAQSLAHARSWPRGLSTLPRAVMQLLTTACRRFNRVYAAWLALADAHPDRTLIVRHEDLAGDVESVMRTIETKFDLTRAEALVLDSLERRALDPLPPELHEIVTKTIDWTQVAPLGYAPVIYESPVVS